MAHKTYITGNLRRAAPARSLDIHLWPVIGRARSMTASARKAGGWVITPGRRLPRARVCRAVYSVATAAAGGRCKTAVRAEEASRRRKSRQRPRAAITRACTSRTPDKGLRRVTASADVWKDGWWWGGRATPTLSSFCTY